MSALTYLSQTPGVAEFVQLRIDAGLSEKGQLAATKGLEGTYCSVCARDDGKLVGMGRVIGDGGCFFQIVDIAVHPDYQRRGIGIQVMTRLMEYLRKTAPKSAYVSLIADGGATKLYEKFGFELTAPASFGMALRL